MASPECAALISTVADWVTELGTGRLRVAVDGLTEAGKTSFGHELAAALRRLGRATMLASMDDFKHPWRHAREHGYDRLSGEGYYRNAYDFASARELLLIPAGPAGSGEVALCGHDPLTGHDHRDTKVRTPPGTILIADTVFAFRPQYNDCWEYRIWLDVDPQTALRPGITRDTAAEGADEALRCPLLAAVDGEMLVVGGTGPVSSPSPADRAEGRNQDPPGVGHPWSDIRSVDVGGPSRRVNASSCFNVGILKSVDIYCQPVGVH
jgi:uridine kinase